MKKILTVDNFVDIVYVNRHEGQTMTNCPECHCLFVFDREDVDTEVVDIDEYVTDVRAFVACPNCGISRRIL